MRALFSAAPRGAGQSLRRHKDVRVVDKEGELLRHLELDPSRNYQGWDRELS
jgi:hypothetical protein